MPKKVIFGIFALTFLLLAPSVYAQTRRPSPRPTPALNEIKLRACQSRQEAIQNRMSSLVRLSAGMVEKFDSIAERVKTYYQEKVLPGGGSVPNYQDLVDEITAKKTAVDASIAEVQTKVDAFSCDSDNPKGMYNEFRLGMQKVKGDLKNYRTAIKNLIVAVKRVAPISTPTPEPEE